MSAQAGNAITLGYGGQGAQQTGGAVLLSYSPPAGIARKTVADFHAPWGAATARHLSIRAPRLLPTPLQINTRARWAPGQHRNVASRQPWGVAQRMDAARRNAWLHFAGRPLSLYRAPWGVAQRQDHAGAYPWAFYTQQLALQPVVMWGVARKQDAEQRDPWGQYDSHLARSAGASWAKSVKADMERWNPWTQFSRTVQAPWSVIIPDVDQVFTLVVPVRKVYMVINNATLTRVDGNIALPAFSLSLSLDVDSWTWSFSATLPGQVLPNLEPAYSGAPVEVEAVINGVPYRALVERIGRSREFGKSNISVQGRGKTALLDSPYAPVQNFINASARTAQQLMGDVLTVNGVPMGWTVDWGLEDWLVPAGVFSHQGSYISALNAIAQAAGGYVQPDGATQTLFVLPRYAVAPWNWGGVTPDFILPSDVTTREGIEWVEKARYNRVYVSGQQAGVLGQVTRTGTAGDLLAPMVTDALITVAAAARQRGLSILSNTGRQAEVSLRLPVLAETGIITPGKFVQYTDAGVVRRGVVRSTSVEVGMPEIWQNLGVETHA